MATLLLADDSFSLASTVQLAFAQEDVRVLAVLSGEGALASMEADPPAIVLADIGMARVNGYDIASYMKNSPALAHIPVLLLTSPFDRIDEDKARATGCSGVLMKPLEPRLLVELVRRLLAGDRIDPALLWQTDAPLTESRPSAAQRITPEPADEPKERRYRKERREEAPFGWRASREGLSDPATHILDSGLDRLDEAFASASAPPASLTDVTAAEFESDMTVLRGSFHVGARRTGTTHRAAALPATAMSPAAPADLDDIGSDARRWIPEQPQAASAPSQTIKIRLKIGSVEFEAEGPAELVQAQLEDFKRLAGVAPAPTATIRHISEPRSAAAPRRRQRAGA